MMTSASWSRISAITHSSRAAGRTPVAMSMRAAGPVATPGRSTPTSAERNRHPHEGQGGWTRVGRAADAWLYVLTAAFVDGRDSRLCVGRTPLAGAGVPAASGSRSWFCRRGGRARRWLPPHSQGTPTTLPTLPAQASGPERLLPRGRNPNRAGLMATRSTGPMANPRGAGREHLTIDLGSNANSPGAVTGEQANAPGRW
jgi:hypothetical protein